jgi:addiction module RelB/DinJ family antitoxin
MSKSASMYIRIDPEIKSEVETIYARYGMSVTEAINIFLYQSRNIGGLPFDLRPAINEPHEKKIKSMKGSLKKYADPALIEHEKGAWERAAAEKHGGV